MSSPSLAALPDECLVQVFQFLSNTPDILSLERTSKRFYEALQQNDESWQHCRGATAAFVYQSRHTFRDSALRYFVLTRIRKEQKTTDNIFIRVLGLEGVHVFLDHVCLLLYARHGPIDFVLRGDALGELLEWVQDFLIRRYANALKMAIFSRRDVVSSQDFGMVDSIDTVCQNIAQARPYLTFSWLAVGCQNSIWLGKGCDGTFQHWLATWGNEFVLNSENRRRLVRLLAYRAGIVKMTSAAFQSESMYLIRLFGLIFSYAITMNPHTTFYNLTANFALLGLHHDIESQDEFYVDASIPDHEVDLNATPPVRLISSDAEGISAQVTIIRRDVRDAIRFYDPGFRGNSVSFDHGGDEELAKAIEQYRRPPTSASTSQGGNEMDEDDDFSASTFSSDDMSH